MVPAKRISFDWKNISLEVLFLIEADEKLCFNKEILLDSRFDEPLLIYSRFVGMTISELFSSGASLWYQYKFIVFIFFLCKVLMITCKILITTVMSNKTPN